MTIKPTFTGIMAIAIIIIVIYLIWRYSSTVKNALDVTSQTNVISGPINKVVSSITGVEGDTLGTALNRGVENITNVVSSWTRPAGTAPYTDQTQVQKTCSAILKNRGYLKSAVCIDALNPSQPD